MRSVWAPGTVRRLTAAAVLGGVAVLAVGIGAAGARPGGRSSPTVSEQRQRDFAAAAREFDVPEQVLLAVSYALTHWSQRGSGGYGPMHLTDAGSTAVWPGHGRAAAHRAPDRLPVADHLPGTDTAALHTMSAAARLAGVGPDRVRSDTRENIRAGAALLAHYAAQSGARPSSLIGWYGAIARYATGGDAMSGRAVADDVVAILRQGVPRTVVDGEALQLPPAPGLSVPRAPHAMAATGGGAQCPAGLGCRFVPAAYARTSTGAGSLGYGNYDQADRPADGNQIQLIVLDGSLTSYDATIAAFQQPSTQASAHYLVSATGAVTQLVPVQAIAWHSGNRMINAQSIGILQEAVLAEGAPTYTEATSRATARLVRWLTARYSVPLDRAHVIGRDEVAGTAGDSSNGRTGLGPYWDWSQLMRLAGAPVRPEGWRADRVVTIAPRSADNRPPVSTCDGSDQCGQLAPRPSDVVYLRTEPSLDAPLLADPGRSPATAASTRLDDWAARAAAGQSYAVADQRGDWVAIWFGGRRGWFQDPGGALTVPGAGALVTARPGLERVAVYSAALPESSAYPSSAGTPAPALLPVTIQAGQSYVVTGPFSGQDYLAQYAEGPSRTGTLVVGSRQYVMITFDHRQAFVDAADVALADLGG